MGGSLQTTNKVEPVTDSGHLGSGRGPLPPLDANSPHEFPFEGAWCSVTGRIQPDAEAVDPARGKGPASHPGSPAEAAPVTVEADSDRIAEAPLPCYIADFAHDDLPRSAQPRRLLACESQELLEPAEGVVAARAPGPPRRASARPPAKSLTHERELRKDHRGKFMGRQFVNRIFAMALMIRSNCIRRAETRQALPSVDARRSPSGADRSRDLVLMTWFDRV